MKYIILLICSVILPIISLRKGKPKLCINCKYFISDNKDNLYGKCSFFPKEESKINFLVNGIKQEEYFYCSTTRSSKNMCDKDGKYYIKINKRGNVYKL